MASRKTRLALGFVVGLLWAGHAQAQSPWPVVHGKYYQFQKIADGVYYATAEFNGTAFPFGSNPFFGANLVVIVNDKDVLIVDTGTSPAAARAFVADIKLLTDKPVRYVVNTHWHYDHTDGNSIFGPEVQIIGHEYVRHAIQDLDVLHREPFQTAQINLTNQIDPLQKQIAGEKDPAQRATLEKQLAAKQADSQEFKMLKPTPPNVTYSTKMTVYQEFQGQREIQLLFLG